MTKKVKYLSLVILILLYSSRSSAVQTENLSILKKLYLPSDYQIKELIQGDFDNDGKNDIAAILTYKKEFSFKDDIQPILPFYGKGSKFDRPFKDKAFLIVSLNSGDNYAWFDTNRFIPYYTLDSETNDYIIETVKLSKIEKLNYGVPIQTEIDGDVILIPTEAGIDEAIFFSKGEIVIYAPEEMP